jgi:hypothetical protein
MSELAFDYSIRSEMPSRSESPAQLGSRFVNTLDALTQVDPKIFANWEVMDYPARASTPLAEARDHIGAIIEKNVDRDDFGQSYPQFGYSAGALVITSDESRRVSLRIKTGGTNKGETSLHTGTWNVIPDPEIVTYPIFKSALLAINANWPPRWACAYAFRVDYYEEPLIAGAPLFPYSLFHITWIAYLSAPLAVGLGLPLEISTDRTPDGGVLMTATKDRLDPTNPEHLRRARMLAEVMIERTGQK